MQKEIVGRLPTIPEYYRERINKNVDLDYNPKQCCPFHKEDTPSFSYSAEKGKWRCFGSCKCGGDVIDLHKKNYNLQSRAEAKKSLKALYHIIEKSEIMKENINFLVNEDKIIQETLYQKALSLANNVERWLELDYFMSKTPIDVMELELIVKEWESIK